jgi:pilus assembly protein CpaB
MQKKVLVSVLTTALLAAAGLELYMRAFEARVAGGEAIGVLITTRDLRVGELLTAESLSERTIPEAYLDRRHVRSADKRRVLGTRLEVAQSAGGSLLWSDLSGAAARTPSLAAAITVGMRALTLDHASGTFSGLLEPGDHVDVLAPNGAGSYARVLENLVVLAVGQRLAPRQRTAADHTGPGEAREAREAPDADVTLRVTPEQADLLANAVRRGAPRLALRNPGDALITQARHASTLP